MLKKVLLVLTMSVAILTTGTTVAHAYTNLGDRQNLTFVKVKRPIFTGQYTKVNGHKGSPIISKKGTILKITMTMGNSARFNLGQLSYKKQQRIYQTPNSPLIKQFNTKYFESYTPKLPIREQTIQAGTYTTSTSAYYKPIFMITMDGYLQYYSEARLKHYQVQSNQASTQNDVGSTSPENNPLFTMKPTQAVKIKKFIVNGRNYYLYFQTPVKGLKAKKVSKTYYRLKVTNLGNHSHTWFSPDGDFFSAKWINYLVGGQPFYYIVYTEGGD